MIPPCNQIFGAFTLTENSRVFFNMDYFVVADFTINLQCAHVVGLMFINSSIFLTFQKGTDWY